MSDDANVTATENQATAQADSQVDATETGGEDTQTVDQLLSEYDQETGSGGDATTDAGPSEATDLETADANAQSAPADIESNPKFQQMFEHYQNEQRQKTSADLDKAASVLQQSHDALAKVPERVLRGVLQDKASDKRFVQAFINRGKDPQHWEKLLTALGRELGKEFEGAPDKGLSDNMSSLRSAVKSTGGTSASGPSNDDIVGMSDSEFQDYKRKHGIRTGSWG